MARMAGRARAAGVALALAACGGGGGGSSTDARTDDFDRQAMVAHLASSVIAPTYDAFAARAGELDTAVAAWCDALGEAGEEAARADAQGGWRAAMTEWQHAEVMLVGPAAMDDRALRDAIDSWPFVSSCAVDQDVATRLSDPGAYDISTRTPNRRGLPALEYILFAASLDHTCPSQVAPAGWDELADADRLAARCGFAADAADDVAVQAGVIALGWSPAGGDYIGTLSAGPDSELTPQAAANLISDAMFYVDSDTKDMKLAEPAGITDNSCGVIEEACAAELESPHARHSKENVVENLVAIGWLFRGDRGEDAGGLGFEEFLDGLGGGTLADEMDAEIEAAIETAGDIPGALEDAITGDRDAVIDAHAAVKAFTDDFKSQFLTILGLDAPDGAAGDND